MRADAVSLPAHQSGAGGWGAYAASSFPFFVRFFLFVFLEGLLVFVLVFIQFFNRRQFQRGGSHYLEGRAALIATDGVAFIYIFFIHIDSALTSRTCDHRQFLPQYTVIR